jgi:hypothetical protein
MIINSLSAVSYGNFDPTTPAQQALTIIFVSHNLRVPGLRIVSFDASLLCTPLSLHLVGPLTLSWLCGLVV